jgi:hypothetical protein
VATRKIKKLDFGFKGGHKFFLTPASDKVIKTQNLSFRFPECPAISAGSGRRVLSFRARLGECASCAISEPGMAVLQPHESLPTDAADPE